MHSVTDRQTDGQTDRQTDGQQAYANSRSYCVAVRSAKNETILDVFWAGAVEVRADTHPLDMCLSLIVIKFLQGSAVT